MYFKSLKQLEFIETKLKKLGINYYVEDDSKVLVNAPVEFANEMDKEIRTKFIRQRIWIYSNYPRIIGDLILKD